MVELDGVTEVLMAMPDRITGRRFSDSVVQNHDNQLLGHVDDVVIDPSSGQITHVMLALTGPLWSTKRVLVSWDELQPQYDWRSFLMDAQPEDLVERNSVSWDLGHRGKELSAPEGRAATACWDADPAHG